MLPAMQLMVKMEDEMVDKVGKVEIEDKEDKVHNKIGINWW